MSYVALAVSLAPLAQAQNREKFGISAKAGGVNKVVGQVWVKRAGQTSEQRLTSDVDLASGDVVSTGVWARAEILLNPGSYLRLGENSQFELVDSSLDNLRLRLIKGTAILEAIGGEDTELRINILTEQQPLVIVRRGLYRINAQAGTTELLVQKGRAQLGNNPKEIAKGGKKIVVSGTSSLIAKIGKYEKDEFDNWSKERGQALAQANIRLSARTMSGYSALNTWGFGTGFGRLGLWTYNTSFGCYTFLPFTWGYSSVYGDYRAYYYLPHSWNGYGYGPPVVGNNPNRQGGSSGGSGGSSGGYGSGGSGSGGSGSGGSGSGGSGSTSSPRSVPTAPPPSMPSQAGPRDPDSGSRSINRIKDPN